jgi:hypothetical protein
MVVMTEVVARGVGVCAGDLEDKAVFYQKLKRPVAAPTPCRTREAPWGWIAPLCQGEPSGSEGEFRAPATGKA